VPWNSSRVVLYADWLGRMRLLSWTNTCFWICRKRSPVSSKSRAFSPDLIVSHAFEGGHIDHDACHVLAQRAAHALGTQCLEFPVYWKSEYGKDIFQQFRESRQNEFALHLSQQELLIKRRMLAEYRSQVKVTSVFHTELEHFRPISKAPLTNVAWHKYPFENRYRQLKTKVFLERVAEFQQSALSATA